MINTNVEKDITNLEHLPLVYKFAQIVSSSTLNPESFIIRNHNTITVFDRVIKYLRSYIHSFKI